MSRNFEGLIDMLIWYIVMLAFTGLLVWPTVETQLTLRRERRERLRHPKL